MVKKQNQTPKDENKRDKFLRLVNPRVNRAVHSIGLIGNCASAAYEYKEADIAKVLAALNAATETLAERFSGKTSVAGGFKID